MDHETMVSEGLAKGCGVLVAVIGGEDGVGENIIHIDARVEGRRFIRVEKGVHGRVGDGGNKIPSKWRSGKGDIDGSVVRGQDREDESVGVGWGKEKRPVKICNISSMEVDELAWTE
jgi:hypothetical protein